MIKRFLQVSIAVQDLDAAIEKYSNVLGTTPTFVKPEAVMFPGVKAAVFLVGDVAITLIASERDDSLVAEVLKTRGEGIFLMCFEVSDVEQHMKELVERGVRFLKDQPSPYPTGNGKSNYGLPDSLHGVYVGFAQFWGEGPGALLVKD